jgi:deoxyhypusine synthase
MTKVLANAYSVQTERKKPLCASELIALLGKSMDNKDSIIYWAAKNNIPVFSPALTDGSFGDMIFFEKQRNPDFFLDISEDMKQIVNLAINAEKTGVIALGAGSAKHYSLNAQIFREGCDYAVFINTSHEFDGSDSGASTEEAVSWGKIKPNAPQVKVHGDATILFPLLMAAIVPDVKKKIKQKK